MKEAPKRAYVRGPKLVSFADFQAQIGQALSTSHLKPRPYFAGTTLPYEVAARNFFLVGAPGSGKSTVIDVLMNSTLPGHIGTGQRHKAIVYDHSRNSIGTLSKMGFTFAGGTLKTLNPVDPRGVRWEMCDDIKTKPEARRLASILVAKKQLKDEDFWNERAETLMLGIILSFIKRMRSTGQRWQLLDVIEMAFSDIDSMITHLSIVAENSRLFRMLTTSGERSPLNDILTVFESALEPLVDVARRWQMCKESITVKDFLDPDTSYVLVLGVDKSQGRIQEVANRIFLTRLVDEIINRCDKQENDKLNSNRIWFFLDEGAQLGEIPSLIQLME